MKKVILNSIFLFILIIANCQTEVSHVITSNGSIISLSVGGTMIKSVTYENTPPNLGDYFIAPAPEGHDDNPGTYASPWLSIDKVNSEMSGMGVGDTISFKNGGTYDGFLEVSANGVLITAYGIGSNPKINSLQTLGSSTNEGGNIYSWTVEERVMQVFVNGVWVAPSRFPTGTNTTAQIISVIDSEDTFVSDIGLDSIEIGAQIHIKNSPWDLAHLDVIHYGVNSGSDTIITNNDVGWWDLDTAYQYYITGVYSALDAQNEWAYNSTTKKLYLYSTTNPALSTIEVTKRDTGILVTGNNVRIEHLNVFGANDVNISIDGDSTYLYYVTARYSNNNGIETNDGDNQKSLTLDNCGVIYSKGKGMAINDIDNVLVTDCYVRDIGTSVQDGDIIGNGGLTNGTGVGMYFWNNNGLLVTNNLIQRTGGVGIYSRTMEHRGRVFENNTIRETMLSSADGGAFYSDGGESGGSITTYDTIRNNTIDVNYGSTKGFGPYALTQADSRTWTYGIYIDEANGDIANQKWFIEDNVIDSTETGMLLHNAKDIYIRSNDFSNFREGIVASRDSVDNITIYDNNFSNYTYSPFSWKNWDSDNFNYPTSDSNDVIGYSTLATEDSIWMYTINSSMVEVEYDLAEWQSFNSSDANSTYIDPREDQYTLLYEFTVEDEDLGTWTEEEINAWMYRSQFSTAWARTEIVIDTINEEATKVIKVIMDDGVLEDPEDPDSWWMQRGLQATTYFNAERTKHDTICITNTIKFDKDWETINGNGKFGGLQMAYAWEDQTPPDGCGTGTEEDKISASFLFKPYNKIQDYQYSNENQDGACPWAIATFNGFQGDSTYLIPGVWYDYTECVRKNTFDGSTPNADGIFTAFVYDDLVFQKNDIQFAGHDTSSWNTIRLSTFSSDDKEDGHTKESYIYLGGFRVWIPGEADTAFYGNGVYDIDWKMTSRPGQITDRTVYYDTLVNLSVQSTDTIYTTNYPTGVGEGYTAAWLIDAGEGYYVKATAIDGDLGSFDALVAYDGYDADDIMLARVLGSDSNFHTDCWGGDGILSSSGRYMHIHVMTSNVGTSTNFRIKVERIAL